MSRSAQATRIEAAIAEITAARRTPSATYRLQFRAEFPFAAAQAIIPYLDALGISDLYASPIWAARAGSHHGYDVSDPTRLNPELGGEAGFDALSAALRAAKLGLLLDVVPNHMGINDPNNIWWWDVLENGPSSPYSAYFDVQWQPDKPELANRVLLPVLGEQYGTALENGQIRLHYADGAFLIGYFENRFPVAPGTYDRILTHCLERLLANGQDEESAAAQLELESIITAVGYLPGRSETDPERVAERAREKEVIKRRIATLYADNPTFRRSLDATVEDYNGRPGDPQSFDPLDALIEAQVYRLAFWRVAGEEINYRRFFDINELAALRVEDPAVFAATHALPLRLLLEGKASGLRIDHPDGLYDPPTYFRWLQEHYLRGKLRQALPDADGDLLAENVTAAIDGLCTTQLSTASTWPLYVVAEKILSENEPLPLNWAIDGTTGYDFLAAVNGLQVSAANRRAFDRLYQRFTGMKTGLADLMVETKALITRESMVSELDALSHELERIGERNRHYRDFTLNGLRTALRTVIACLPVYRTYINPARGTVSARDRRVVQAAVRDARRRRPGIDDTIFAYVEDTLLLKNLDQFATEDQAALAHWIMRFQQLTGPVMAKGVEDTAFYRYYRLASLNEVGGSPAVFGISPAAFHEENARRAAQWPHSLLATSTHDNKRSEDVRARINVLAEIPEIWRAEIGTWARLNAAKRADLEGESAPDRNDEYLLYQTLLGAWPFAPDAGDEPDATWGFLLPPSKQSAYAGFCDRIVAYMQKAAKEAKVHTSWTNPNPAYDEALADFVGRVLDSSPRNRFLAALAPLARTVARHGQANALAQLLLKLTSPGVPDIYQGNELWDFSLVDPDNRRPVDYDRRRDLLAGLAKALDDPKRRAALAADLAGHGHDGRIKLYVTALTLRYRRAHPARFAAGDYLPLEIQGEQADHVCAFARRDATGLAVTVVPRLPYRLTGGQERLPVGAEIWQETRLLLPAGSPAKLHNLFTGTALSVQTGGEGATLALADVLAGFPVALLVSDLSPAPRRTRR